MGEACTLTIRNSSDAIVVRARVREFARQGGLDHNNPWQLVICSKIV
jgi:hypothetical protein